MKSETLHVQQVFQERRRYRVPFYQRAYVWDREEQWDPLWNDIREKAESRVNGQPPAPHFLGAIVLEPQPRRGLRGVDSFHIIDGQQRLTTLQYFLAALGMALRETNITAILTVIEGCLWNPNPDTMEQPEIERFKVWPTFRDRETYQSAMEAETRDELRSRFGAHFTQRGSLYRIGIDHPSALEAIWFFREQIDAWVAEENGGASLSQQLESLAEAVLRDLRLVSISLDETDDAQVIFETLNGRGAELHPTDLIRNFIFMRADRDDDNGADLYDTMWAPFEAQFWIEDQRRGRLRRPRLEWFVQTALQAELRDNVDVGRLYASYRRYGLSQRSPVPARRQLEMLTKYAGEYRQLVTGSGSEPIARFGSRISVWDASPTHSFALRVASIALPGEEQEKIYEDIVSYIVRRAVCGLTIKNYNNLFLQLLKQFEGEAASASAFRTALSALKGRASRWPTDDEFRRSWLTEAAYGRVGEPARVRTLLVELENGLRSSRREEDFVPTIGTIDIDHILPDKWYTHWPLDGVLITAEQVSRAYLASLSLDEPDIRTAAINRRERLKATMGNLTLVHYGINRSVQNDPFSTKRERLFAESNLHLNRPLMRAESWDESSIERRGIELFEVALRIWPGPEPLQNGLHA